MPQRTYPNSDVPLLTWPIYQGSTFFRRLRLQGDSAPTEAEFADWKCFFTLRRSESGEEVASLTVGDGIERDLEARAFLLTLSSEETQGIAPGWLEGELFLEDEDGKGEAIARVDAPVTAQVGDYPPQGG